MRYSYTSLLSHPTSSRTSSHTNMCYNVASVFSPLAFYTMGHKKEKKITRKDCTCEALQLHFESRPTSQQLYFALITSTVMHQPANATFNTLYFVNNIRIIVQPPFDSET